MSSAPWGGQTESTTSLAAARAATVPASSSSAVAARAQVSVLRPSEAQSTRDPPARAAAPTDAPISPGWSNPIVVMRPSSRSPILPLILGIGPLHNPAAGVSNPWTDDARKGVTREETGASEPDRAGVDRPEGVVRRPVDRAADGAGRHGGVVGAGHPGARDHVGRGGAPVPAPHSRGRHAPALLDDLRRDRRLQRPDDGPEGEPFAPRGTGTARRRAPPGGRPGAERSGGRDRQRHALPPSSTARHV